MTKSGNVIAYVVNGEPVNFINEAFDTPIRANTINYIGSYVAPAVIYGVSAEIFVANMLAGATSFSAAAYGLHRMDTVKADIDCNN